jgi:hypothetical protein
VGEAVAKARDLSPGPFHFGSTPAQQRNERCARGNVFPRFAAVELPAGRAAVELPAAHRAVMGTACRWAYGLFAVRRTSGGTKLSTQRHGSDARSFERFEPAEC